MEPITTFVEQMINILIQPLYYVIGLHLKVINAVLELCPKHILRFWWVYLILGMLAEMLHGRLFRKKEKTKI